MPPIVYRNTPRMHVIFEHLTESFYNNQEQTKNNAKQIIYQAAYRSKILEYMENLLHACLTLV